MTPKSIDQAIASVENILRNPKPFTTTEISAEIRTLFSLLQEILKELPQDLLDRLAEVRNAIDAGDRKKLLREAPDAINICKDAWQTACLQHYNEVKRYLKFVHENRRTPTLSECRALKLVPDKLAHYQADLDRFLREGESPEDLGPADDSEPSKNRDEFIAKVAEHVSEEWGRGKRPISIPALVIEGGYSFSDAISIAQWLTDHHITPETVLEPRISDRIAFGTHQAAHSQLCPVCGQMLPSFSTGDSSVICEECGFEVKVKKEE